MIPSRSLRLSLTLGVGRRMASYESPDGLEIARGNVPGVGGVTIPGRKDTVGTTNLEDLTQTGNTVMPRPAGTNIEVISSSDADNGATATGALTVEIEYLDVNGDEQRVILTLDGTTPINVGTAVHDIQWMHTVTVGSNTVAVGNIQLRDVATGLVIYEQIAAGGNQSLTARYKIPNGKTGYIMGWHASAITQKMDFRLRADVHRGDRALQAGVFNFQDAMVLKDSASGHLFAVPLECPSGSTIKMSAVSFTATGDGGGGFDLVIVNN